MKTLDVKRLGVRRLVALACYLGIGALLMMAWSVIDPRALPVVLGMSVGQGLGVMAFACFALAVVLDARRASEALPPPASTPPPPASTPSKEDEA